MVYVTSSDFKRRENEAYLRVATLADGERVADLFSFRLVAASIKEVLEVDLEAMVTAEVRDAYEQLRIPCLVEHAGLLFSEHLDASYPGGLTKPMWNALGAGFIEETQSAGRAAIARAVVAYCDGMSIRTYIGETAGRIADAPRGARDFYWDTIFVPEVGGKPGTLTYAEITDDPGMGLDFKMNGLSQSARAMTSFLEDLRDSGPPDLWPDAI